jgi:hypothetical protein
MPRRIDILTLGLSSQSRWNPLYRRWARRVTERNLTAGLKALLILRGGEFVLDDEAYAAACNVGAYMEPTDAGVRYWISGETPPANIRILWGKP